MLLRIADGASSSLLQAWEERLRRDARTAAFREALLHMDSQIDRVGAGLRSRDLSFFQALRAGTATLAELQVTWALAGIQDPGVEQDLGRLSAAFGRLRHRYGPEWVRFRSGRPLSEDERLRLVRLRAGQSLLAEAIEPLRDRADRVGDEATAEELTLLLAQIQAVTTSASTLGDYLDASVAADSIRGAWYGARATHATDEAGWAEADRMVAGITTDESVGFVFTTGLNGVEDWSFVEEETEIPVEIAGMETEEGDSLSPELVVDFGASGESESEEMTQEAENLFVDEQPAVEESDAVEESEAVNAGDELDEDGLGRETGSDETMIEEEDLDVDGTSPVTEVQSPPPAATPDGAPMG